MDLDRLPRPVRGSDDPDDSLMTVRILSLPSRGVLNLMGVPLTVGQMLYSSLADYLVYQPAGADWHGNDSFTWSACDGIFWSDAPGVVNVGLGSPVVSTVSLVRQGVGSFLVRGEVSEAGRGAVTDRGVRGPRGRRPTPTKAPGRAAWEAMRPR